ncbi:MAG: anhydro-N-acetylmuramic acid kinase, partial [Bacteroidales bacterium]|nr:anhydro-N-acetylmuramic acid kinase [Bacteroidales bacterium]
DYISSHGHTVFHQPHNGFTFQIGNGAVLAAVSGKPVVCDFRTQDVALGGQGAPLVPIGDKYLFADYDYCLNIGGFSNISFDENGIRKAFDISPSNMALNYFAAKEGLPFDKDGLLAEQGRVQHDLLAAMNGLDFYKKHHAKSLGKEWFENVFLPVVFSFDYSNRDNLATITEHIACQIACAVKESSHKKMLMTGGGVKNKFLTRRIAACLPLMELIFPDERLIDYKEALIFAFLGYLRINNEVNCLKTVTDSKSDHIAGAVYLG